MLIASSLETAGSGALKLRERWRTPCMGNLEKLSWIDAFAVSGYGVRVGVRVNDAALIGPLRERLPPGAKITSLGTVDRMLSVIKAPPAERRGIINYNLLYADHVVAGRSRRLDEILGTYDTHLRLALAQFSRRKLFVHAGVVAWRGAAIVLPGRSLAGKTHLVAELVKAGASYFSVEYAVLDEEGFAQGLEASPHVHAHSILGL